jgi:hypothetical protein
MRADSALATWVHRFNALMLGPLQMNPSGKVEVSSAAVAMVYEPMFSKPEALNNEAR